MPKRRVPLREAFERVMPGSPPPAGVPWIWRGTYSFSGYGLVWGDGEQWKAHRAAYELFVGSIPNGMIVRHTSDIKGDVNPNNLIVGTHADNVRDKRKRGRMYRGETHYLSQLSEHNVRFIRTVLGPIESTYGYNQRRSKQHKAIEQFFADKYQCHYLYVRNIALGSARSSSTDEIPDVIKPVFEDFDAEVRRLNAASISPSRIAKILGVKTQDIVTMLAQHTKDKSPVAAEQEERVREIRRLHDSGLGYGEIAERLGTTYFVVYGVVTGRTWKHIE